MVSEIDEIACKSIQELTVRFDGFGCRRSMLATPHLPAVKELEGQRCILKRSSRLWKVFVQCNICCEALTPARPRLRSGEAEKAMEVSRLMKQRLHKQQVEEEKMLFGRMEQRNIGGERDRYKVSQGGIAVACSSSKRHQEVQVTN